MTNDKQAGPGGAAAGRATGDATGDAMVARLAELEVLDAAGMATRLGETWRDGPIVLAFVRHFG